MTASRPIPSITRRAFAAGIALAPLTLSLPYRHVAALQATPAVAPAGDQTMALGINDAGQIVVSDDTSSAILTLDGEVVDIEDMYYPVAINNRGQVVGNTGAYGTGLLWEAGQVINLPMHATDLNDAGQVCGVSPGLISSVVWQDGELVELPVRHPGEESRAYAINNAGLVVGSIGGYIDSRPVLWEDGELVELPVPPGTEAATPVARGASTFASATGISDAGHIAGMWGDLVVLWRDGEAIALPMPPGANWSAGEGFSYMVNSAGQVAGTCVDGTLRSVAVLWEDGEAILLPMLPGDVMSWAWGLNEAGQVVGQVVGMSAAGERSRAVLWQDGEVIDLSLIGRE